MLILVYNYQARLGNRLFAFAHLIAFSKTHQIKVRYPGFEDYGRYFKGTANNLACEYPPRRSLITHDRIRTVAYFINRLIVRGFKALNLSSSVLHKLVYADLPDFSFFEERSFDLQSDAFVEIARSKPIVFMIGRFFRDYQGIETHQDAIREFFKPIDSLATEINAFFRRAKGDADIVVGVHRRGEDYREFVNGKYYYTEQQYHEKLKEVRKMFPNLKVQFIICSNDEIDLDVYSQVNAVKGPGPVIMDLYTLAKCDYIVGAPSTYSMWAAFYGNKPLCRLWSIDSPITMGDFQMLPKEKLYNYSFN